MPTPISSIISASSAVTGAASNVAEHAAEPPLSASLASQVNYVNHFDSPAGSPVLARAPRAQANRGRFNLLSILNRHSNKVRKPIEGFNAAEQEQFESLPKEQRKFVRARHAMLEQLKFKPVDMLALAVQSPDCREAVLHSAEFLRTFKPVELISFALSTYEQRGFILQHYEHMLRSMSVPQMLELVNAPQENLEFFTRHWDALINTPMEVEHMHLLARMPTHARSLLVENIRTLHPRRFRGADWITITSFNERQCDRLIRESNNFNTATNRELLHDIALDPPATHWPENLSWLDETSRTALIRWANIDMKVSQASELCRNTISDTFLDRLQKDPAAQPLGTLVAGLAFTAGYKSKPEQIAQRVKAMLGYLELKNDLELWKDCQAEAKDAIEHCGDRVDYGFARLAQVIERHKMTQGELPPAKVLGSVLSYFNRDQVEITAQIIALEKNIASESIEVFLSLASQLALKGIEMGELPDKGLYTNMPIFRVAPDRVAQVKDELDDHREQRSPEFRAAFEEDLAVQSSLRDLFPAEYQALRDEREKDEDAASDLLLAPGSTDAQRQGARKALEELGNREPSWYGKKAQEALANRPATIARHA